MKELHKRKFVVLLILCSFAMGIMPFLSNSAPNQSLLPLPDSSADETYMNENARVYIYDEGNINAAYSLSGTAFELQGVYWDIIYENFQNVIDSFQYAGWSFHPNSSASDNNLWFYFQFRTEYSQIAESYATYLIENVETFSDLTYSYSSSDTWSNWDGYQDVYYTTVYFNGHSDWTDTLSNFNDMIPKDKGGLAESIDINSSDYINWYWNFYDGQVSYDLNFEWYYEVEYLEGDYSYSVQDLLHVDELKKSTFQDEWNPLNIWISLPDVDNLILNRGDATIEDQSEYMNPWDVNYMKYINLDIHDEFDTGDLTFSFSHKFTPYDLIPREYADFQVNPYGYSRKSITIYHENAYFVNWTEHIPNVDQSDILASDVNFDLRNYFQGNDYNVYFYFRLKNESISDEAIWNFTQWIMSTYGWDLYTNGTWEGETTINDLIVPTRSFNLYFNRTDSFSSLSDLWVDSWIFQKSEMLHHSDLSTAVSIDIDMNYRDDKGGYSYYNIRVYWDEVDQYNLSPEKSFSTSTEYHSLDIANLFGWPLINKSEGFQRSSIWFEIPIINEQFDITEPVSNWGYGYDSYQYTNSYSDGSKYIYGYMNKYLADAYHEENGVKSYVNNIVGTFENTFHEDSDDLGLPYDDGFRRNFDSYDTTFVGVENLTINTHDRPYDYVQKWNGSEWEYRYGMTPVVSVDGTMTFQDIPMDSEKFSKDFSMIPVPERNENENEYHFLYELNSSTMVDGTYSLYATITDQAGNAYDQYSTIVIDNYNDSLSEAPQVAFIHPTPLTGTSVNGTVPITLNITDDIEIFAIVVDIGGSQYLLNEENYLGDGIYVINWTTTIEAENSDQTIEVSVWDIEGHKVSTSITLTVDNLYAGEPPEITLIIPGMIEGEVPIVTGLFNFSAEVYDDFFELESVQFQIDDRVQIDMNLEAEIDDNTGLYTGSYDVSNLVNGTHTLTIIALDRDDPNEGTGQHMRTAVIEFFANTTITGDMLTEAPEIDEVLPGNFTSLTDTLSEDITISVKVHDNEGIESVNIRISKVLNYDTSDMPSSPQDVDLTSVQITVDANMYMVEDYYFDTYEYEYDSTDDSNGLYLVEITIGDVDAYQHQVTARFVMIVFNEPGDGDEIPGNDLFQIPGFNMGLLIMSLGVASFLIIAKMKRSLSGRI